MKIYDFTVPELEKIRALANFTPEEADLFERRARGDSLIQCADEMSMSISSVKRLSVRVNRKIIRIC